MRKRMEIEKKKPFTYTITIVTGPIYESEIMERRTFHIPQLLEVLQVWPYEKGWKVKNEKIINAQNNCNVLVKEKK
jgi:hypothetical protein